MKKICLALFCACAAGCVFATPSVSEVAKMESGVAAIVSDVVKRENGVPEKIADALLSLEGDAQTVTEKFLFRRSAVLYYMKALKCEQTKKILERFTEEDDVASVSAADEYIMRRLTFKEKKALKTCSEYKAYEAFVKESASSQKEKVAAEKRLQAFETAYAKDPENARNRNLLAMEYAVRGDWNKAIPLLKKARGVIAEAALAESATPDAKGSDAVAIADKWWEVVGKGYAQKLTEACRRHAVEWYRVALPDEGLPNLVKLRIGGRIEEIEAKGDTVKKVKESDTISVATGGNIILPNVKVKGGDTVKMVLDNKGKVVLELATCEPGTFMQDAFKGFCDRRHQVTLTYPYLIGKSHLTYGMVKAVDKKTWKGRMDKMRSEEEKFHNDDMAFNGITDGMLAVFLVKLNAMAARCRELKAYKGYEFRLPTEAEWVRAYQAGTDDEMEDISDDELKKYWSKLGNPNWKIGVPEQDVINVLQKKPNAWGIFNMARSFEDLVDKIPLPKQKDGNLAYWLPAANRDCFGYADHEANPIRICTDKTACHIARKGKSHKIVRSVMWLKHPTGEFVGGPEMPSVHSIRLVYGPKLDKLNVYPKKEESEKK